jgi:hypothetical protein
MRALWVLAVVSVVLLAGCLDDENDPDVVAAANTAIKTRNPGACGTLTLASSKDACYRQVAVGLKDDSVCKRVSKDGIDDCFFNVAVKTDAFSPCFGITESGPKAMCLASVGGKKAENAYSWANSTWQGFKSSIGL